MANWKDLPRGKPPKNDDPENLGAVSSAHWLPPAELRQDALKWESGKIMLGAALKRPNDPNEHLIGIGDNRHVMTIAGSRAGKGTSCIVPNLRSYLGSVLVVDPKGENAMLSAKAREAMGQKVYVIDPFGVTQQGSSDDVPAHMLAGFNPLAGISPASPDFVDECDAIADALVAAQQGKENDHWNTAARDVLRGFIAWAIHQHPTGTPPFTDITRMLAGVGEKIEDEDGEMITPIDATIDEMIKGEHVANGTCSVIASRLRDMGDVEFGSVMSTTNAQLSFMSSDPMAKCLDDTDNTPDLRAWKYGGMSIYICLPASRLHRHFRFFRLMLNRLLGLVEGDEGNKDAPALMVIDEMHILGNMQIMEKAAALIAGFGVKIWSFWQDINQLKRCYGDGWETFIGNCGILQTFGINDMTTLKYISERLGRSQVVRFSASEVSAMAKAQNMSGESHSIDTSALLEPHELALFLDRDERSQIIITTKYPPIFARRVPYFDEAMKGFANG